MNLIDEKKEFRSRIEGLHAADSRFCAVDDAETFWREREKPAEIEEYDFNTIPELETHLQQLWQDEPEYQEMAKFLAVAAFKAYGARDNEMLSIPAYVYVF